MIISVFRIPRINNAKGRVYGKYLVFSSSYIRIYIPSVFVEYNFALDPDHFILLMFSIIIVYLVLKLIIKMIEPVASLVMFLIIQMTWLGIVSSRGGPLCCSKTIILNLFSGYLL